MFGTGKIIRNNEDGSVLMEAVLAFPVLIFLFGATLWSCDLMLARSRLMIADRQASWWGASRLSMRSLSAREKAEAILEKIDLAYFSGQSNQGGSAGASQNLDQDVAVLRLTKADYSWTGVAASKLSLSYELPLWLQGILAIPKLFWEEKAHAGQATDLYTVNSGMDGSSQTVQAEIGPYSKKNATLMFGRSEYGSSFRHPRNWRASDISGRPKTLEFLNFNQNAVFEPWDKYIVREISPHNSWSSASAGVCSWLAVPRLGADKSAWDLYPILAASPSGAKAYKRYNSFENWSE
ncbi:MAG: TadE family protein [Lentisphaeria bacterium]